MMYQNDQWNVTDELGMASAGDGLAKIMLSVSPPFTTAVTGKWGAGKTSIMQRAYATLGGDPISKAVPLGEIEKYSDEHWDSLSLRHHKETRQQELGWDDKLSEAAQNSFCVWYSPWQHQGAGNPLVPLLLEIRHQVVQRHSLKKLQGTARQAGLAGLTLLERVIDGALVLTGKSRRPVMTGATEAVRKAWKEGKDELTELSDGQRFHLQFEDAVKTVLQSLASDNTTLNDKARLIVFIDDLDRCEESIVIQLLEAIKLYLGTPHCVFVLGLDNTAVLEALRHHWPDRSEDHNREYLEKLFQATIRVPAPQLRNTEKLIYEQLKQHDMPEPMKWAEQIVTLVEPNPRKLKNFTNSLCAAWGIHNLAEYSFLDEQLERLVLFQYLALYHPTVWRVLERQPWALQVLYSVLAGNKKDQLNLPEGYSRAEQRTMEQFFSRSFGHILSHDSDDPNKDDKHRGLDMEKAVDLFLERIDRKRSDEVFAKLAVKTFSAEDEVDECFLCIVTASRTGGDET